MQCDYELMYIVRPELDEEAVNKSVDSVKEIIEGLEGTVTKTTLWGKRRLAYEVKHLNDGYYVITQLRIDGDKNPELNRVLAIHDTVFRHLLVRKETVAEIELEEAASAASSAPVVDSAPASEDTADNDDLDDVEVPAALDEDEI